METLEENLKKEEIKKREIPRLKREEAEMLAEELRAISSVLEGKAYEPDNRKRAINIPKYLIDTTKSLTEKIHDYIANNLKNFYPTSQKVLSSIILGPTISLLMNEFLKQYYVKPETSHLFSLGVMTSVLSYCLESLYQKQDNF